MRRLAHDPGHTSAGHAARDLLERALTTPTLLCDTVRAQERCEDDAVDEDTQLFVNTDTDIRISITSPRPMLLVRAACLHPPNPQESH